MADRRLRPLSLGDIFDEGFDLYKRNLTFLVLVTVVVTVPLDIVAAIVRLSVLRGMLGTGGRWALIQASVGFFTRRLGSWPCFLPAYALVYAVPLDGPRLRRLPLRYLGTAGDAAAGLPRAAAPPAVPALTICCSVLSACAGARLLLRRPFACCLAVLFVFAAQTFALEGKAFFKALGRSSRPGFRLRRARFQRPGSALL